ncbi:MAG: LysM peptidoglycan-binding domain-containing protein [Paenibacillus sp.]|uniref:LysM peptidoglycan-binding domain-containing protein n=1 Tax=Paenibacillus sp. TaxID=58172 RepID=UPI00290CCAA6|nr:LysM peptidoglycan-binding domain-containing protein [Paenibacillus sp.]MDU4698130.1 LysM peptidoglycan-binding domain-containing protein [Paenibacillus sp.]
MKIHIVKKGDTLFELSKKYNVPLEKLKEANPQITNPDQLNIGDKVKIPAVAVPIGGESGNVYKYVVKQGDTLWKLSKAWGLPLQTLIAANPQLSDPNQLKVGDIVNIPTGSAAPMPSGGANNPSGANTGLMPAQTGKKNTAPIAGAGTKAPTGVKPEMTAPKPAKVEPPKVEPIKTEKPKEEPAKVEPVKVEPPKQQPVNVMPPKQQPVHVEPPKAVPMEIKVEVEQIQYETTKLQPIHYEPQKHHEPVKIQPYPYEPMNIAPVNYGPSNVSPYNQVPMKGEHMGVSPYSYEPMKGEHMGVSPYSYEPMKGEPMGVSPYSYEPMKGEPTGVSPYGYEPMKGEPTGVSPYGYEPMKGEPAGVSPYSYEPMKGEPAGVSPYSYEPMKGEPTGVSPYGYEPMKGEPTGVSPYASMPNIQPNQYMHPSYPSHLMPQAYPAQPSPSILPAMGYAPSPCGCSGTSPYPYAAPEAYPPFYQYPIAAEPVSAYNYDNSSMPTQPTALSPTEGGYPGISNANAPASQMPDLAGISPYGNQAPNLGVAPYGASPQAVSPESYSNAFNPQAMDWGHHPGYMPCYGPPVPGYPASVLPAAYAVPPMHGYPMAYPEANNMAPLANEPLKGEVGGIENMKGHFGRESQASLSGDGAEDLEQKKTESKSKTQASSKKNVKISGSPDSQASSKKQSKSGVGTDAKKTRPRTGNSSGRRNPWINA